MTHAVDHTVFLTDRDSVEVSHGRALRIVDDIIDSLRRHIPGATPAQLEDAARNLAAQWGMLGVLDGNPEEASQR